MIVSVYDIGCLFIVYDQVYNKPNKDSIHDKKGVLPKHKQINIELFTDHSSTP